MLASSPAVHAHQSAVDEVNTTQAAVDELMLRRAALERLVRAVDNLELAARLTASGGHDWQVFERLRACEKSLGPLGNTLR